METYENCSNCEHYCIDEKSGMRTCNMFYQVIYILLDSEDCPRYKKKEEAVIHD